MFHLFIASTLYVFLVCSISFDKTVIFISGFSCLSAIIIDFNIASSSINAPGKVKVTVRITDDISGVQWVKVFYYNPSKTQ